MSKPFNVHAHLSLVWILGGKKLSRSFGESVGRCTWEALNGVIDSKQRDGGFKRRLETANLAHGRFQNAGRYVVPYLTVQQVEAVTEVSLLGISGIRFLGSVVAGTKFRDKVGRVFGCVHGKGFRNHQKRTGKLCNRKLLPRTLDLALSDTGSDNTVATHQTSCEVFQIDAQSRLNCPSSWNDRSTLKCPLDDRQSVVQGTFHLIQHVVVSSPQHD